MKLCPKCNTNLNDDCFYKRDRGGLSGWCKKCANLKSVKRITKARQDFKTEAICLFGNKCELCGFNNSITALVFHHKNPKEKDFSISLSTLKCKSIMLKELEKCILLCANCHMEVHEGMHPDILKYEPKLTGQTRTRRKHKNDYIQHMGGACSKCGYNKCNRALNFHHLHNKKFVIGTKTQLPKLEALQKELKKCVLLCANCHAEEHT